MFELFPTNSFKRDMKKQGLISRSEIFYKQSL